MDKKGKKIKVPTSFEEYLKLTEKEKLSLMKQGNNKKNKEFDNAQFRYDRGKIADDC